MYYLTLTNAVSRLDIAQDYRLASSMLRICGQNSVSTFPVTKVHFSILVTSCAAINNSDPWCEHTISLNNPRKKQNETRDNAEIILN
jgi:hypothetical protein